MPRIGLDVERALNNRSGLGQFSRWYLEKLATQYPEAECYGYSKAGQTDDRIFAKPALIQPFQKLKTSDAGKLDVFHALSNYLPHQLFSSGQSFKKVVTVHDVLNKDFPENYDWGARIMYDYRMKQTLKYADVIVCISEYTKQRLTNYYEKYLKREPLVIYQSIPTYSITNQHSSKANSIYKKTILCIGTVEPRKNQLAVIEGYARSGLDSEYDLVVIGRLRGTYGKKVEALGEKTKGVKVAGQVSQEALDSYYADAVGAVYLSLGEGFGLPVLEAVQRGLPILTSGGGAMQEAGGDSAIYANPADIESIANGFRELISARALELIINNRTQHLARFDSKLLLERYWKEAYGFH